MTTINTHVTVIATLTPTEGKEHRLQEVLSAFTRKVHYEEPDTLRYQLHRQWDSERPVFVMIETYRCLPALRHHHTTPHFNSLVSLIESEHLLSRPLETLRVQPVAGYTSQGAEISGPSTSDDTTVVAPAAGDRTTEGGAVAERPWEGVVKA